MTSFKQVLIEKVLGHKYAIDAERLGDDSLLAWSNLGYWQAQQHDSQQHHYRLACQSLADQVASSVQLKQSDRVLDLGCGQGASLLHWLNQYQIEQLSTVELQADCIQRIQKNLPQVDAYCQSFLNLKQLHFLNSFDAVICIDAAYHSDLNSFLNSTASVLNSKGRLAFHYLMWSDAWQNCSYLQKQQYRYLLKSADVKWQHLMDEQRLVKTLTQHGFGDIVIQDFSAPVFNGFAQYIETGGIEKKSFDLAQFKIGMTAKLCRKLYHDGLVRYIQISAVKHETIKKT
ncbi:class I SAM-dependent methyltransferase [Acinetobacter sp. NIPH 2699]|uniref:SAM-dependent methyltransferase n=1 Tax=Acinetobacter sp. NIPH 2699 TaxID=2923433 RepID=UPI001F4B94B6|nr:class I SAM-dependent methyltransferase [Acinetobacter sp. NIPH 2699]MCH7335755.1 class I SAM-dependent methyltransferase [Acinetobacter sp. NIPH 2699]